MRVLLAAVQLVGFMFVVAGFALWSVPAALIVAGVATVGLSLLVEQGMADEPDTE